MTPSPALQASPRTRLAGLVEHLRMTVDGQHDVAETVNRVAASLTARTPTPKLLTASQRSGDPDRITSQIVHAEDRFSVVALVLRPGQQTAIHDHLTWCVVTVLCGTEHETVYRHRGSHLTPATRSVNSTGSVTALVPPGDIHRVRNESAITTISLHVYGADLRATGSSVRRSYELPVQE